jgi:hypothetical protein
VPGNAIYIWNVNGAAPALVDSVIVSPDITRVGDVQTSDDGRLLVVPTELDPGSVVIYDLADPTKPRFLARFASPKISNGVHTCEVQRVGGRLYAFLSINRSPAQPAHLMILDLSDPAKPLEVLTRDMGEPTIHDVFVRDGLLFTALWDGGMTIWDIGGGGRGGSVQNPIELGNVHTVGGSVHNIWWYHDGQSGQKRYVFVGEEGPGSVGLSSSGDIHVVDISDATKPREIAFYHVDAGGTHNFWVDEGRGVLYAAYYNAGVEVIDVRGDLSDCPAAARSSDGRCDLMKVGRRLRRALVDQPFPVYIWGVQLVGQYVYASDILNGIWKLAAFAR